MVRRALVSTACSSRALDSTEAFFGTKRLGSPVTSMISMPAPSTAAALEAEVETNLCTFETTTTTTVAHRRMVSGR